jgi:hypothetical protein
MLPIQAASIRRDGHFRLFSSQAGMAAVFASEADHLVWGEKIIRRCGNPYKVCDCGAGGLTACCDTSVHRNCAIDTTDSNTTGQCICAT